MTLRNLQYLSNFHYFLRKLAIDNRLIKYFVNICLWLQIESLKLVQYFFDSNHNRFGILLDHNYSYAYNYEEEAELNYIPELITRPQRIVVNQGETGG